MNTKTNKGGNKVITFISANPGASLQAIQKETGIKLPLLQETLKELVKGKQLKRTEKGKKISYSSLAVATPKKETPGKEAKGDKKESKRAVYEYDEEAEAAAGGKPAAAKVEAAKKEVKPKDRTKYSFNGVENLGKGPLALAVVKFYVSKNPKVTFAKLKEVFPDTLMTKYGVFTDLKDGEKRSTGRNRYFLNEDQQIKVADKTVVVTNQWTADNFVPFLKAVKEMGYKIK